MRLVVVALALYCAPAVAEDLYVFVRPGCEPCRKLKAAIEDDSTLVAGYTVRIVETQDEPALAKKYRVKSVPTLVILDDSEKELRRTTGYTSEANLRAWLDKQQQRRRKWLR